MKTGLAIQIVSTFVCDPIAASLGRSVNEFGIAGTIRVAPPSELSGHMLAPSSHSEDIIGTIVLVRVEDWLRELPPSLGQSHDNSARQALRKHLDEFLGQLAVLALRGCPVWLVTCPSTGWIARECNLVTLCRTMTNLLSARIRNSPQVKILDWPSALSTEECFDRVADRAAQIPFSQGTFDQLGESIASQLERILASNDPNAAMAVSERSPGLAAFLAGLRVQVEVAPATLSDRTHVDRILRTAASFSLAGERPTITEAEIDKIVDSGNCLLVSVADRLAVYGPSGVVVAHATGDTLLVDSMSLSCTVLGKQVEYSLLTALAQIAADRNLSRLCFEYRNSGRNLPILAFLRSSTDAESEQRYVLPVNAAASRISRSAIAPGAWSLKLVINGSTG